MDEIFTCPSGRNWSYTKNFDDFFQSPLPPSGLTEYSENIETRLDAFNLFIDDFIVDKISNETNRKAIDVLRNENLWNEVDADEIRAFFGVLLIAGALNINKRNTEKHWNVNSVIKQPIFQIALSKNRFDSIRRFIRFDDFNTRAQRRIITIPNPNNHEENIQTVDRILHIRHRITHDNYFTSINEALLMKNNFGHTMLGTIRRNKRDIPHQLISIKNREVLSSLFAYSENMTLVSYLAKRSLPVLLLTTENITTSSDFNRRNLLQDGTYLPSRTYNRNEINDNVTSNENILSNENFGHNQEGRKQHKYKPYMILEYNRTKGGVDTVDLLVKKYPPFFKTRRWPFRLMQNFLALASINAYKLYCLKFNLNRKQEERWDFLINLSIDLIKNHALKRLYTNQVPHSIKDLIRKLYHIHAPAITIEYEDEESCISQKRRRCVHCPKEKDLKTRYVCSNCRRFSCLSHSKRITTIICGQCLNEH
ncbi:PiggyBac transposable element-derived protein 4-like protein [Dinothrombium tinctorium]|uniref:PiggyBac transposable element-derived protein 4-like protein n=2 Tax=Dinothrombium tinctorium TaxID=1965070 RepID=A0A3S3NXJ3_9ACAR|nr:PiggyBac transposable element-derived protein 4-like protein [Dinothrombium tinctorium]